MTFNTILFKMLKSDAKKYKLFIICNLLSIAILYSFISILKNEDFMNASIVDPMISSNIYMPTVLVFIFVGLFIPYSQNVFIKSRQKDYGILLTIGMTENEVRNNVLKENFLLYLLSTIIGLCIGTLFSLISLIFIKNIIGISVIKISISIVSYKITSIYVFVVFIISLCINLYVMIKSSVYEKIIYTKKAEHGKYYNNIYIYIGVIITIIAFIIMIIYYNNNSNIWFMCIILSIIGSILIFFNGEAALEVLKNNNYQKYIKNIFLLSDIKYYYGKNKKILLVNCWIFFAILFFSTFSFITYPNFTNNAIKYNPFHMAYIEMNDFFKPLGNNEINNIIQKNNNNVEENYVIEFVRNNKYTIFCVDDVNESINKNYKIPDNQVVYIYTYYKNDGYEHNIDMNISNIKMNYEDNIKEYGINKVIVEPFIGKINAITKDVLLVNNKEYELIKKNCIDYNLNGKVHLYNFSNWKKSESLIKEIKFNLKTKNNINKENQFYKISSRIEAYNIALKSSKLLIFLIVYICILLYFAVIIMIHYKLSMEYNDEKEKYLCLYKIGIKNTEIKRIVSKKVLVIFFCSLFYSIIINIIYIYYVNSSYGYGIIGIMYSIIISIVLSLVNLVTYKVYSKNYYKKIILDLDLNR